MALSSNRSLVIVIGAAVVALTIGLTGGVYAGVTLDGSDIRKGSISGSKLKKDTLTGKQIKESTLSGFAPAGDTGRIFFDRTVSSAVTQQVLKLGSLRMSVQCAPEAVGDHGSLRASSTASAATFDLDGTQRGVFTEPPEPYMTAGSLDATAKEVFGFDTPSAGYWGRAQGTLIYHAGPAREAVVVDFVLYVARSSASVIQCQVVGAASRVGP